MGGKGIANMGSGRKECLGPTQNKLSCNRESHRKICYSAEDSKEWYDFLKSNILELGAKDKSSVNHGKW